MHFPQKLLYTQTNISLLTMHSFKLIIVIDNTIVISIITVVSLSSDYSRKKWIFTWYRYCLVMTWIQV